jgi:hypothetical protein
MRVTLSIRALVKHADEVARLLPAESMQGRIARETASDLPTGTAALDTVKRFDRRFDRLVSRSVRQRNGCGEIPCGVTLPPDRTGVGRVRERPPTEGRTT